MKLNFNVHDLYDYTTILNKCCLFIVIIVALGMFRYLFDVTVTVTYYSINFQLFSTEQVTIHVYALASNDTYNENNMADEKTLLSSDELLSIWRADAATGEPASTIQGKTGIL